MVKEQVSESNLSPVPTAMETSFLYTGIQSRLETLYIVELRPGSYYLPNEVERPACQQLAWMAETFHHQVYPEKITTDVQEDDHVVVMIQCLNQLHQRRFGVGVMEDATLLIDSGTIAVDLPCCTTQTDVRNGLVA